MRRPLSSLFLSLSIAVAGLSAAGTGVDSTLQVEALVRQFDQQPSSRYLPGYKFDRLFRRREFKEPLRIIPLEMYYGLGFYGGYGRHNNKLPDGWMNYEAAVTGLRSEQSQRIIHELDLDIFRTNLSYYLLGVSWADISTGLNLRYSSILGPPDIPNADWGATQAGWDPGKRKFDPRILGLGISNAVVFQWEDWWFLNFRYSYGLATARFYYTDGEGFGDSPGGWGPAVSYDLGIKFILDRGQSIQYSFGVDLRHSYTRIDRIDDPNDVTPISSFRLPAFGLYVTLAAFYGGRSTSGDLGKQFYYRRDFITAREKLNAFLVEYPRHAARGRAQRLVDECTARIPEQLYREGRRFEQDGDHQKALERYRQAQATADSTLLVVILAAYERLALTPLEQADELSGSNRLEQAYQLVRETAGYSQTAQGQLPEYEARLALQRGRVALKYGFYSKALEQFDRAQALYPALRVELGQLRYQVAAALIKQANQVQDLESIQLAVQSLETAKELTGGLNKESSAVLEELRTRLARYDAGQIQRIIDREMAQTRENLQREIIWIKPGMTIPEVQDILGEPSEWIQQVKADGSDYQLWIYRIDRDRSLNLSFADYILFKIERP
ncbi:MAG: hypothetical protein ABIA75_13370 [Candidatus Neomarinimicrobiota bacterium]